jgi:hypothetical protein
MKETFRRHGPAVFLFLKNLLFTVLVPGTVAVRRLRWALLASLALFQ